MNTEPSPVVSPFRLLVVAEQVVIRVVPSETRDRIDST